MRTYRRALVGLVFPVLLSALPVVPLRAAAANADFSLALSSGPTFNPGTSGTFTATVTPLNGENAPVTLVPDQSTAPVTPAAVVVQPPYQAVTFTISVSAKFGGGTFPITVQGADTNGNQHAASTTYTLTATPADFRVALSPSSITVAQGGTGSVAMTITATNGFNADVQAVASSASTTQPLVPVPTWSSGSPATSVSPPYPAQVLTVTVSPKTSTGPYTIAVTATSANAASNDQVATLTVNVVSSPGAQDFALTASTCPTFDPGTSTTFTVTVTPLSGENTPVTLQPNQGQMQVSPPATVVQPPYGSVTFTVSESAKLSALTQSIVIEGVDANGFTHAATTQCVSTATPADYSLSATPSALTIVRGATGTTLVSIAAVHGLSSDVVMVVQPNSVGQTIQPIAQWSNATPTTDVPPPYPSQTLTITVPAATAVGSYQITITATSGNAASNDQTLSIPVSVI